MRLANMCQELRTTNCCTFYCHDPFPINAYQFGIIKKSRAVFDPAFSRLELNIQFKALLNSLEPSLQLSVESHEFLFCRHVLAIFVTHSYRLIANSVTSDLVQF